MSVECLELSKILGMMHFKIIYLQLLKQYCSEKILPCAYQEVATVLQLVWNSTFVQNLSSKFFFCVHGHHLGLLEEALHHQLLKSLNGSWKLMKSQIHLIMLELALQISHLLSYSLNNYDKLCMTGMRLEFRRKWWLQSSGLLLYHAKILSCTDLYNPVQITDNYRQAL